MNIKHILASVDFSEISGRALLTAACLAEQLGARMTVSFVRELLSEPQARVRLDSFVRQWVQSPELDVTKQVLAGSPAYATIDDAAEKQADLLVCGTHGRTGLGRVLLGSFAEKVVRAAPCPVWVARGDASPAKPQRILLPIDFSKSSEHARSLAVFLASGFGARLSILHVLSKPELPVGGDGDGLDSFYTKAQKEAESYLNKLGDHSAIQVDKSVEIGDPARRVVELAAGEGFDLIVCGTHGRTGIQRWIMGSVAEKIVRTAPCSVLVVPTPPAED